MSNSVGNFRAKELMQSVLDLKEFCDVILVSGIDQQKFPAHRLILTASSKYFAALLGPNFREGNENEIRLEGIDGSMLKTILDYIYTAEIEITAENVGDIIAAASSVELIALEIRCGEFWTANLAIENCVETYLNADKYHLKDLWSNALKFIGDHFEEIAVEDIQQIDAKNFGEVLKYDRITAAETIIFDRLVQWMNQNEVEAGVASEMLKSIRLAHIPTAFLIETVEPFFEVYDCGKIVVDECRKRLLDPKTIRLNRFAPEEIYCSSVNSNWNGINIQKYDSAGNKWDEFKNVSLGTSKYNFGSIVLDGELFVLGGQAITGSTYYSSVDSYNLENASRTSLPNMTNQRSQFTPIAIGKYIYVIGGCSSNATKLDACERYDTVGRVWQLRQKIPNAIYGYAIEELNGQIYIFGGYNSARQASQDLYCYYPDTNAWTEKSRIAYATISCPSLAKTGQFLYAMQYDGTVHQYEPARDLWTTIGSFGSTIAVSRNLNYYNQIYAMCSDGKFGILKLESNNCAFNSLAAAPNVITSTFHLFKN